MYIKNDLMCIRSLSENNQAIITHLCELLGIKTKMISASEINTGGHRSTHLLNICKAIDASIYNTLKKTAMIL